ncbi:Protein S100-A14 [Merluccius polli]|uniref:Protein S100-A14 n=1 Tax=Merluccius polli TaxID=89951 RepID=A0AA47MTW6_MERPO|nr:Protein S100-A14 [Merluccius polli]KAK0151671.1 Protein S100-A14 [Merluccius polli]
MAVLCQYSDLELALNTLVTGFHSEAKDGSQTLDSAEFQTLVSKQLPALAKTVGEEGGLQKLLKQIGVEEGQDVTFENFWTLVQKQATDQFAQGANEKVVRCSCNIS